MVLNLLPQILQSSSSLLQQISRDRNATNRSNLARRELQTPLLHTIKYKSTPTSFQPFHGPSLTHPTFPNSQLMQQKSQTFLQKREVMMEPDETKALSLMQQIRALKKDQIVRRRVGGTREGKKDERVRRTAGWNNK